MGFGSGLFITPRSAKWGQVSRGFTPGVFMKTPPSHLARGVVERSHVQGFLGNPSALHRHIRIPAKPD